MDERITYIGLDVHKETIAVAFAVALPLDRLCLKVCGGAGAFELGSVRIRLGRNRG